MDKNCLACENLKKKDANLIINGWSDTNSASFKNDTGLVPSDGSNDCTDLGLMNDCLIGNLDDEVEISDVCDWRDFMHKFIPNVWTMFEGTRNAICGLWTNVYNIWDYVKSYKLTKDGDTVTLTAKDGSHGSFKISGGKEYTNGNGLALSGTKFSLKYEVGDVICENANTDPSIKYGGTWGLIQKDFKTQQVLSGWFTPNSNVVASVQRSAARLHNQTVDFYLEFTTASDLKDREVELGTINLRKVGLANGAAYFDYMGGSDDGNGIVIASWEYETSTPYIKKLTCDDVITKDGTNTLPSGSSIQISFKTDAINVNDVLDEFCDMFFFTKTA